MLAEHVDASVQLVLRQAIGVTEDNTTGMLDLIVEKFAEVFHVKLAFVRIDDSRIAIQHNVLAQYAAHGSHNVGELADTRGLDQNTVRGEVCQYLCQCFGKIANQRAADTALIHFGDLYAAFLQKAAVNADLSEFIFNQYDFLAGIGFFEQFFDQRRFSRTEKTGKNINLSHSFAIVLSCINPAFDHSSGTIFPI